MRKYHHSHLTYYPVVMNTRQHQLSQLDPLVRQLPHPVLLEVQVGWRTGLPVVFSPEILDDDTLPRPDHRPHGVQHSLAHVRVTAQH